MKLFVGVIFFLSTLSLSSQEVDGKNYTIAKSREASIAKLSLIEFRELVFSSGKTVKIIYFFNQSCSASIDFSPKVNDYYRNSKSEFDLYVVPREKQKNEADLRDYLFYYNYSFPVYMLDKRNLNQIIDELCPECNTKVMGYSSFFVLDSENKLLVQSDFNKTDEHNLNLLKKYIN